MGKLIVVTSGKGGVGKSTVSTGLAAALCSMNKSVLLVDADEGLRCLDLLLSISDKLVFDMGDILSGNVDIDKAINKVDGEDSLYLLAAPSAPLSINSESFGKLMLELRNKYDYVIVDCPAGIDNKYYVCLPKDSEFLIVTNSDAVSVRNAFEITNLLSSLKFTNKRLVLNRFDKRTAKKFKLLVDDIIDNSGVRLLAVIPEDSQVKVAALKGKVLKLGRAAMALHRAAARIQGLDVPLPKLNKI